MLDQSMFDSSRPEDVQDRTVTKPFCAWNIAVVGFLSVSLYAAGRHSFLLFHTLAEAFSIIVACAVAMLAWNSRRYMENNYVLFIASALGCMPCPTRE